MRLTHKLKAYQDWLRRQEPGTAKAALACLKRETPQAPDQWAWISAVEEVVAEELAIKARVARRLVDVGAE